MAHITAREFDTFIRLLTEHYGLNFVHERLLKANALVSRKRPSGWQPLASQLYQLSAGLRRDHPARHAIELLWQDMMSSQTEEDQQDTLDTLAERINACLTEKFTVIPEKQTDLTSALGAYQQAIAALSTDEAAYTEILLRASTDVAKFLREHKEEVLVAPVLAEKPAENADGLTQEEKE